ncbi:serine/threonine protein kinase [Myxococcota bacterium]|nr:serine/threonine protein kinase [Myxococcota bacterium]
MAEVFVARRRGATGTVVIKRIRPDLAAGSEYLKRFVLEAQVASRLSHPNLVKFREFGKVGDCHYIAMDEVRGWNLQRVIDHCFDTKSPMPLELAMHVTSGLLEGLAAMHGVVDEQGRARPMVHRDVTPKNVIIRRDGHPVVIDFGIAKDVLGPAITMPGKIIGTARYMAPEHRKAEFVDPRADVFSVGVIFFELLTARHPWKPLETIKELLRFTFDPPELTAQEAAHIPADVLAVVMKSLACEPGDRFSSAKEMVAALSACASFRAMGSDGDALVRRWLEQLALATDQDLQAPIVDHGPKPGEGPDLVWNPSGSLTTGDVAFASVAPEPVDASVLTIPPLPPPREAALGTDDASIDLALATSRPMWGKAVVIGIVLVLVIAGLYLLQH